jgi:hypothetical protein
MPATGAGMTDSAVFVMPGECRASTSFVVSAAVEIVDARDKCEHDRKV